MWIIKKIHRIIVYLRSVLFCFKVLPFSQAICIPILLENRIKTYGLYKGCIEIMGKAKRGQIRIGGGSLGLPSYNNGGFYIEGRGKIQFVGKCIISEGSSLRVGDGALLILGDNFFMNKNCYLRASEKIVIGDDCIIGWNVTINDTDGHKIIKDKKKCLSSSPIIIGNHVWISSYVVVGKGAYVADDCVVGQKSLVINKHDIPNSLIVGSPAKIIRNEINWEII